MATYYAVNAGGNWTAGATWSTTSAKDASRTGGSTAPTASDDCIIDDYSGNVTVSAASVGKSLDCNSGGAYTGTLTFNTNQTLTISGSVTFSASMTIAGIGNLTINAAGTLTSAGISSTITNLSLSGTGAKTLNTNGTKWGKISVTSGAQTVTLTSDLQCTTLECVNYGTMTFAGAYDITCDNLYFAFYATTLTLVSGQTLTVTTFMRIVIGQVSTTGELIINASTASSPAYLVFQGTAANCVVCRATFTDIDASDSSIGIDNWYGGTLTRTSGITNRTSADIGGGGGLITHPGMSGGMRG